MPIELMPPSQALEIAENAIRGSVDLPPRASIHIDCSAEVYIVTFLHPDPPTGLRADYEARVTVDGRSGDVVEIRVGA